MRWVQDECFQHCDLLHVSQSINYLVSAVHCCCCQHQFWTFQLPTKSKSTQNKGNLDMNHINFSCPWVLPRPNNRPTGKKMWQYKEWSVSLGILHFPDRTKIEHNTEHDRIHNTQSYHNKLYHRV